MLYYVHKDTLVTHRFVNFLGRDTSDYSLVMAENEEAAQAKALVQQRGPLPPVRRESYKPPPVQQKETTHAPMFKDVPETDVAKAAQNVTDFLGKYLDKTRKGIKHTVVPVHELAQAFIAADYVSTVLETRAKGRGK